MEVAALVLFALFSQGKSWTIPLPGGRQISYKEGLLRIQFDKVQRPVTFPTSGTLPAEETLGSIRVQNTGTAKGYGAYCVAPLPKHTFLGFYEGQVITSLQETTNYEYVVSLDGGATFVDGFQRAQNRSVFSPCHLNHADRNSPGNNCFRTLEGGKVAFFTSRRIDAGEELCFDYGDNYWRGREHLKL